MKFFTVETKSASLNPLSTISVESLYLDIVSELPRMKMYESSTQTSRISPKRRWKLSTVSNLRLSKIKMLCLLKVRMNFEFSTASNFEKLRGRVIEVFFPLLL